MITIKTETIINSNAKDVWNKLIDFNSYPHWNPFIIKISGDKVVGAQLSVDIKSPNSKKMTFKPKLTIFNEAVEMRWVGTFLSKLLFCGEHYFILERIDEDKTRFIHGEVFSGLLANIILKKIKNNVETGFNMMNDALKNIIASTKV